MAEIMAHREPVGKRKLDPVDMEQLQPVDMMKLPLIGMEKPVVITKLTPTGKEKPKEKRADMTKLTPTEKEKVKNYLFPANPYNNSVFEQVLLDQLVSVFNKANRKLFQMRNATDTVNHALFIVDLDMAEDDPYELGDAPYEFDTSHFFYLLKFISLQRIDGRKVDYNQDIRGKKYVMACVLSVPDTWNSCAWEVAIKSHELYAQRKDDFELMIFLRKRLYGWEEFASFKDFLEPFHQSCIVAYLDDISPSLKHNQVLVINLNNRVLFQGSLEDLSHVGSSAFPFEEAEVMSLWQQLWHLKHSSLEALLGVEPSHKVFRKIPGTDPLLEEWRCISEFQSKIVFLYTYHSGRRLALLYDTVKGLREQGVEFEIITAYVPCLSYHNPLQFLKAFSSLVAKRGLSWWVVPYDSSTYPRLRRLYAEKSNNDQLIVFDPNLDDGDPLGLQVLDLYGPSMFPFTKKPVVEHVLKELNKVTLESLFEPITRLCRGDPDYDNDVYENKSVLEGKDVLVYFDSYDSDSPVDEFVSWYNSFGEKEKRRNTFEVVCVYLYTLKQAKYYIDSRLQFPKWLISSVDEEAYANHVVENFFLKLFKHEFSTLVAFGKDGKICSLCAHRLLSSSSEAVTFPFNGDLREEIFDIFNDYFTKLISTD